MNAQQLLTTLDRRGVSIRTDGHDLRLKPRSRVTDELLELCRQYKPRLIEMLGSPVCTGLGGVSVSPEDLAVMPLTEFATAGLTVAVRSEVLDEEVLFVSNNVRVDPREHRSIYRASELLALAGLEAEPGQLRQINRLKKIFKGRIDN